MLTSAECERIRRAHQNGMSIREIARQFHHARRKVREILNDPTPRRYHRTNIHRPKLTNYFRQWIDEILLADEARPPKEQYTAAAIYRILRDAGYEGGYDQVRRYVSQKRYEQPMSPRKPR